jgi:hypothetical protein
VFSTGQLTALRYSTGSLILLFHVVGMLGHCETKAVTPRVLE